MQMHDQGRQGSLCGANKYYSVFFSPISGGIFPHRIWDFFPHFLHFFPHFFLSVFGGKIVEKNVRVFFPPHICLEKLGGKMHSFHLENWGKKCIIFTLKTGGKMHIFYLENWGKKCKNFTLKTGGKNA